MPLPLHRRIGRLAMVGIDGYSVPAELRELARQFDLAGVVLFARNVESPEQVVELAFGIRQLAVEQPLWIGIDQEGGRVARVKRPLTEWPPMATLGRAGDPALATRFARALASELAAIGVSIDFAPVLDVLTAGANPAIGDRALSGDAEVVARLGVAIIEGLQQSGMAACAKHFPGHGDTTVDSHLDLPVVDLPPDRLRAVEFVPFRAAIAAGVAGVMTAHLLVPALDGNRPATVSRRIVTDVLRGELGFDGVVFSDDLGMKGLSGAFPLDRALTAAIAAGCDVGLSCAGDIGAHAAALEALVRAVEREELPRARVDDALARQQRAKDRFAACPAIEPAAGGVPLAAPMSPAWRPLPSGRLRALAGCDEHQRIAEEMRQHA